MERTRWEILVLAAAILIWALAIASSMKANRYQLNTGGFNYMFDSQTGKIYAPEKQQWKTIIIPVEYQ
jgi:hypothetical protein